MSRLVFALYAALLLVSAHAQTQLPIAELTAGFHRIEAEVASDQASQAKGLMHRRSMPANHGMLFVFSRTDRHCMWMRNTLLPLSVAFLDAQGKIINIEEMKPQTEDNHCAASPAPYALEMNLGWFSDKGLKPGFQIGGIEKIRRNQ
jgi:uncharacterized membrane protein (UPF0127 family)